MIEPKPSLTKLFDMKNDATELKVIKMAIVEKIALVRMVLETTFVKAGFHVVINTESIDDFLRDAKQKTISIPDVCLLDTMVKQSTADSIRQYFPEVKLVVYASETVINKNSRLDGIKYDALISQSTRLEQWTDIIRNVIKSD